jgi:hypothetical protein
LFLVGPVAMLVEMWLNSRRSPLVNSNSAAVLAGGPSKL